MSENSLSPHPESEAQPAPFEYILFQGHERTDGSFKTAEQLRSEYVQLTDDLVMQMTEGIAVVDKATGHMVVKRPDVVVWLDKSARPVSWLTKELWPTLAANSEGEVPKMPQFRFLNIDREQWINTIDPEGIGRVEIDRVDTSIIRSLRSIFVDGHSLKNGLTTTLDTEKTELDNKTVLIVDEVYASGRTLQIAKSFMERAFPKANIAATHWMKGVTNRGTATGNADLPVWYREGEVTGRGVGNRDERKSQRSSSRRQRLGSWFLSTALPQLDPKTLQLREEIVHLGEDVRDHQALVIPSFRRDEAEFERRAMELNGFTSYEEFIEAKQDLDSQSKGIKRRPR